MSVSINIQKKHLFFRQDARTILKGAFEKNGASNAIDLDFSQVEFASRSFIDELLNFIDELNNKKVRITIQNLNPRLEKMINRVRATKAEIHRTMIT